MSPILGIHLAHYLYAGVGMPDVVFHAMRHTPASQLIDAGDGYSDDQQAPCHANPNIMLKVYAHLFRNMDEEAADAIDAALSARWGFSNSVTKAPARRLVRY